MKSIGWIALPCTSQVVPSQAGAADSLDGEYLLPKHYAQNARDQHGPPSKKSLSYKHRADQSPKGLIGLGESPMTPRKVRGLSRLVVGKDGMRQE